MIRSEIHGHSLCSIIVLALLAVIIPTSGVCRSKRPAVTDVEEYLKKCELKLYHPDDDGLDFLSFSVTRFMPPGKKLWRLDLTWTAAEGPVYAIAFSPDAPVPDDVKARLRADPGILGESFLAQQLNRFASRLLLTCTATMNSRDSGVVQILFVPEPSSTETFRQKILLFDENCIMIKAVTTMADGSNITELFTWKAVTEDSDLLIRDSYASEIVVSGIRGRRITKYDYRTFEKWVLISGLTFKTTELPDPSPDVELEFSNIIARGRSEKPNEPRKKGVEHNNQGD